jgi:U4/U6 small nuclear ribonucleoprotein PRP31
MALQLDVDKKVILEFVEDRMQWIAPNLSIITGSSIAAQLMGLAGGLHNLSRMPACNVQVLGAKKKRLDGFSTSAVNPHRWVFCIPRANVFVATGYAWGEGRRWKSWAGSR